MILQKKTVIVEFKRSGLDVAKSTKMALAFIGIDERGFYDIWTNFTPEGGILDKRKLWSTSTSLGGFQWEAANLFGEIGKRNLSYIVVSDDAEMKDEARAWMMRMDTVLTNRGTTPRRREIHVHRHRRRAG